MPAPSDLLKNRQKTTSPCARDTHTQFTMTLLGRRAGTACWLTGVVMRHPAMDTGRRPPNCRKPALERLARHSLFDRYMKAQLRLAGGRRKLGRNGFSSDRPRECVDPPNICATCATCLPLLSRFRRYTRASPSNNSLHALLSTSQGSLGMEQPARLLKSSRPSLMMSFHLQPFRDKFAFPCFAFPNAHFHHNRRLLSSRVAPALMTRQHCSLTWHDLPFSFAMALVIFQPLHEAQAAP